MTEEKRDQASAAQAGPAGAGAPEAGGTEDAPSDQPAQLPPLKAGLLGRVNPLKLFRKESPAVYLREGEKLMDNQNLALATMAFEKALSLDSNSVRAYKGMGGVFLRKGGRSNITSALAQYQQALKRDPFDDQSYAMCAKIYERLGQMKEATMERKKLVIVKTLQSEPSNPVANNNMGILMLQQEQFEPALDYFKKSIKSNPNYDIAFRNLAATHYKAALSESGDEKKHEIIAVAKGYIAKALGINRTVSSMLIQGKILLLEGRFDEVLAICEEAQGMEQANPEVYALKRQVLEKLNRTMEAQAAFESYQAFSKG